MQDLRLSDGRLLLNKGSVLNERTLKTLHSMADREFFEGGLDVAYPRDIAEAGKEQP